MDIIAIEQAIEELENSDTTADNVAELALLYIVRDNLKTPAQPMVCGAAEELKDIIPSYNKYCELKRKFQIRELSDEEVIQSLKYVCREIIEFIEALYSGTDMRKERKIIFDMVEELHATHSKDFS